LILKEKGVEKVAAQYIKTLKNSQVESFYDKNSFVLENFTDEIKNYSLSLSAVNENLSEIYNIHELTQKNNL
jgi:predicted enzyme involved in methoxymalonyl-ACP biosynthesis